MRNYRNYVIVMSFLVMFTGIAILSGVSVLNPENNEKLITEIDKKSIKSSTTLTATDPINISSPGDWALYPFITGNGSDINPYIIENVEIHGTGIQIDETSVFPMLNFSYYGIYINSGENFIIRNNIITNFSIGIQFGIGTNITKINNVTIDQCGLGIYSWFSQVTIDISECHISNCNWISTAEAYNLEQCIYGGYGIWARSNHESSIIEKNQVEDCTFGIFISGTTTIAQNELINCGFFVQMSMLIVSLPHIHTDNRVNGKPFKIFWHEDDLKIRQRDADQYGQMLFIQCDYLDIARVSITKPCSVGLYIMNTRMNPSIGIESANGTKLTSIECANQAIGMYLYGYVFQAKKLRVTNCEIGYLMCRLRMSDFTRISMSDCSIPIFAADQITNTTIQLEPATPFYYLDFANLTHGFYIASESSGDLYIVGNESSFEIWFQLNETGSYFITNQNLGAPGFIGFILEIRNPVIPGYNCLIIIGLIGISIVVYYRKVRSHKYNINNGRRCGKAYRSKILTKK